MILVDSGVWVDYFRGEGTAQTAMLDSILGKKPVAVGDLILVEVLRGFSKDREFDLARSRLESLHPVAIGGHGVALQAARHSRELRTRGITVRGTIDCLIATRCITDGYALLYRDRDFDPFVRHLGLKPALSVM